MQAVQIVPDAYIVLDQFTLTRVFRDWDKENHTMNAVLEEARNSVKEFNKNYIVLIAGSTNSGKSTLARYFLNSALTK